MKRSVLTLAAALTVAAFPDGRAMSKPPREDIELRGSLNTTCLPTRGGTVYLHIELTSEGRARPARAPMNVVVVLDRSGSMVEERKIEYARAAVGSLADRLSSEDYLSIVIYDENVETLLPSRRVGDRSEIKRLVEGVFPRGSTNLGGGMVEGFRQAECSIRREFTNRVILISDGLANTGIVDPYELGRIAASYREKSISLTTMGVGLEYNENLMLGLAERGGGNYYFIESPGQLASIFDKEMNTLSRVLVQNASIELELGQGVEVLDVVGCEGARAGNVWRIPVGDLYEHDRREFTVSLSVPPGTRSRHVASGALAASGNRLRKDRSSRFSVDIRYSDDAAELKRTIQWDTQARVDIALSTKKIERAMADMDAGANDRAVKELNEARSALLSSPALQNSPASEPAMRSQIERLEAYERDSKDSAVDKRRLKKAIQYDNYRMQKNK